MWWTLLNSAWHIVGPGGSVEKDLPAVQEMQEMWVQSLGWDSFKRELSFFTVVKGSKYVVTLLCIWWLLSRDTCVALKTI